MIKNQSIIDLWIRSGEILEGDDDPLSKLDNYNISLSRLSVLCNVHHQSSIPNVISYYRSKNWI